MKETKLFELVTGTEMKPWLSPNMLPNIKTCENGWSNFLANLRVVSLKLLQLTQFTWPNLPINFNFLCDVPRDDVIESTRFWWGHLLSFHHDLTVGLKTCATSRISKGACQEMPGSVCSSCITIPSVRCFGFQKRFMPFLSVCKKSRSENEVKVIRLHAYTKEE